MPKKECAGEGAIGQAYRTIGESGLGEQGGYLTSLVDARWTRYTQTPEYAALIASRRQAAAELVATQGLATRIEAAGESGQ